MKSELVKLAEKIESGKRPFLCRLGVHKIVPIEQLITTGHSVCVKCGSVAVTTLWGHFELSREDSAAKLRAKAGA